MKKTFTIITVSAAAAIAVGVLTHNVYTPVIGLPVVGFVGHLFTSGKLRLSWR